MAYCYLMKNRDKDIPMGLQNVTTQWDFQVKTNIPSCQVTFNEVYLGTLEAKPINQGFVEVV